MVDRILNTDSSTSKYETCDGNVVSDLEEFKAHQNAVLSQDG